MVQKSENVGCLILGEFVDDASSAQKKANTQTEHQDANNIKSLVSRVARELGVPQFNLEQIVERVLSVVEPTIEDRVKAELEKVVESQRQSYDDSFVS